MSLRKLLMVENPGAVLRKMDKENTLVDTFPEIAALRMNIPRCYQHKDNLTHSIRVLENAIERETNGPDLILRTAALLHDIGKPGTRKFETRSSVTFDGHEGLGASIVRRMLPKHGYSRKEISEISLIVALHMRSHGFGEKDWSDSAVRRLITDAKTPQTLDRLVIVFYADITTGNTQKMATYHAALDGLTVEIDRVVQQDARKALRPALDGNEIMDLFNMKPGRELGAIMKFLNSDEGVSLDRETALRTVKTKFNL